jgi:hypothetical protein
VSLTAHQAHALKLLRQPDHRGDPKSAEVTTGNTCSDSYTVWVNFQTALALERRGLVKIDKQMDGWDLRLTDRSPDG